MAPSREIEKLQRRWQENPLGLTFAPLAEAYRKEGMFGDALELLEIGLAQHPTYVPAHIVQGRCYLDAKSDVAAEQSFGRVAELDPENVIALKGLADIAERAGRYSDAIDRLERLLAFDRANEDARFQLDRLRAHQQIPMPGTLTVDPDPAPAVGSDNWAPEASVAEPAAELPKAAIVEAPAAMEIELYSPVELTAGPRTEYQSPNDSETLVAKPAPAEADPVELVSHWPEAEVPVAAEEPVLSLAPSPLVTPTSEAEPPATSEAPTPAPDSTLADVESVPAAELALAAEEADLPLTAAAVEPPVEADLSLDVAIAPEPAAAAPEAELEIPAAAAAWSAAEIIAEPVVEAAAPEPALEATPAGSESEGDADPELVVTETMAEIFLRQGHRQLALAVYTQLLDRDSGNERIRHAVDALQEEFRPTTPSSLPVFAAVLTGGQSVRGYFEQLLSARRPTVGAVDAGISLGEVFGEEPGDRPRPADAEPDPSFDEFYGDSGGEPVPAARAPEPPAPADAATEDLEQFTDWLKGLRR